MPWSTDKCAQPPQKRPRVTIEAVRCAESSRLNCTLTPPDSAVITELRQVCVDTEAERLWRESQKKGKGPSATGAAAVGGGGGPHMDPGEEGSMA